MKLQIDNAKCKAEPGVFRPKVDAHRCEGKGPCIEVCPYDVFEMGRLDDDTYQAMPFFTRMKMRAHGKKTVYTPHADACKACGLCVSACPEKAIKLVRYQPDAV